MALTDFKVLNSLRSLVWNDLFAWNYLFISDSNLYSHTCEDLTFRLNKQNFIWRQVISELAFLVAVAVMVVVVVVVVYVAVAVAVVVVVVVVAVAVEVGIVVEE